MQFCRKSDGTLALNIENATCYSDVVNPSSNTAEWNVVVSKTGDIQGMAFKRNKRYY